MPKTTKKQRLARLAATATTALALVAAPLVQPPSAAAAEKGSVKNVILMIPDGMGASYVTATRSFIGERLSFENYLRGSVMTHSLDSAITDSAAAGTALATGYKTNNGMISMLPDGEEPDSILDAAREDGKATGLVANSRVTHATPAVFVSHNADRGEEEALARQYIGQVDVILGGGRDMFLPESKDGRQPTEDLVQQAADSGYDILETKTDMESTDSEKILGLFTMGAFPYAIDTDDPEIPSLAEMTDTALDALSKDEDGFFLMVEGSEIDWAGHANDPVAAVTETAEFNDAVIEAKEFAAENEDTLVIVVADHETGGLNVGNTASGSEENIEILKNAKGSSNAVATALIEGAQTVTFSSYEQVKDSYYVPLRSAVRDLNGSVFYKEKNQQVQVKWNEVKKEFSLNDKEVNSYRERGQLFVDVRDLGKLFGFDTAVGVEDDELTVYLTDVDSVVSSISGVDLTEEQVDQLTSVQWPGDLSDEIGTVVSDHALLSWGSRNHTAVEVPLYAFGPGAENFEGLIDNTDVPRIISYLIGTELFADQDEVVQQILDNQTFGTKAE